MSDPSALPSGFGTTVAPATPATEKNPVKSTVTKRDVTDLLASFAPEPPKVESPAEKERARRVGRLESAIQTFVKNLEEWGVPDGTPADAAAALKALKTVQLKSTGAINSLTEAKLGLAPKTERAPRQAKAEVVETTEGPSGGKPIELESDVPEGHDGDGGENVGGEEPSERPAVTRSGPPAAAASTSANPDEGF